MTKMFKNGQVAKTTIYSFKVATKSSVSEVHTKDPGNLI